MERDTKRARIPEEQAMALEEMTRHAREIARLRKLIAEMDHQDELQDDYASEANQLGRRRFDEPNYVGPNDETLDEQRARADDLAHAARTRRNMISRTLSRASLRDLNEAERTFF